MATRKKSPDRAVAGPSLSDYESRMNEIRSHDKTPVTRREITDRMVAINKKTGNWDESRRPTESTVARNARVGGLDNLRQKEQDRLIKQLNSLPNRGLKKTK